MPAYIHAYAKAMRLFPGSGEPDWSSVARSDTKNNAARNAYVDKYLCGIDPDHGHGAVTTAKAGDGTHDHHDHPAPTTTVTNRIDPDHVGECAKGIAVPTNADLSHWPDLWRLQTPNPSDPTAANAAGPVDPEVLFAAGVKVSFLDPSGYDYPNRTKEIPWSCLLYTSPSPRDRQKSRMPSSA